MDKARFQQYASSLHAFASDLAVFAPSGMRRFGDVMADFQRERFAALGPALAAVADGTKPEIGRYWFEAVKGNSKTSDLAISIIWLLAFSKRALLIQVGAADQDQAGELKKAALEVLRSNPWLAQLVAIQSWQILGSMTKAVCEILAADTAGSHGGRPDVLILDEIVHVTKTEFTANLLDNASKIPHGLVIVATNAGFTGTDAYKLREIARTSKRWHFFQRIEPAPWADPAEIEEAAQRNTPERFARLWRGVWSSRSGDALSSADIQACVMFDLPMAGAELGCDVREWSFVAGLDLGIRHDRSAICVLGIHRQTRRRRLAYVKSWSPKLFSGGKIQLDTVKKEIAKIHQSYGLRTVFFDPYQAILLAEQLQKDGLRMQEVAFVGANLNEMAAEVLESFNSRSIELYRCKELIEDLGRLTIVEKSFGYKLESARDASGHADTATAFALALLAAKRTPISRPFEVVIIGGDANDAPGQQRSAWGHSYLTSFARGEEADPSAMQAGESLGDFVRRSAGASIVRGGERPEFIDSSRPGSRPGDTMISNW